jgi:serine/threonine protein kinase
MVQGHSHFFPPSPPPPDATIRELILSPPDYVSKTVAWSRSIVSLLKDDPSRVFKFCAINDENSNAALEQEKKVYSLLGYDPHESILSVHWINERGLCYDYHPLGTIRWYYESIRPSLPALADRVRWCNQLVSGFAFLHSKGVVHGDITARNVLVTSSMDIKIIDFGSASIGGEVFANGFLEETRYGRWQLSKAKDDDLVLGDLFAVGSLFYEILMGKAPYYDVVSEEVVKRFDNDEFPSLEEVKPEGYSKVIANCWKDQYETMEGMQRDLDRLNLGA